MLVFSCNNHKHKVNQLVLHLLSQPMILKKELVKDRFSTSEYLPWNEYERADKTLPDNEIELLYNNHQLLFGILVSTKLVLVSHVLWPFLEILMLFRLMLPSCQRNIRKLDGKKRCENNFANPSYCFIILITANKNFLLRPWMTNPICQKGVW